MKELLYLHILSPWSTSANESTNTLTSCVCSGHCVVSLSNTSTAGKQPLFNLHWANLYGCSIHQGQLLIQSAGGYLDSPRAALIQTQTISTTVNQGAACVAAQWPYSAARHWVVQLFYTAQCRHRRTGGVISDLVAPAELPTDSESTDRRSGSGKPEW